MLRKRYLTRFSRARGFGEGVIRNKIYIRPDGCIRLYFRLLYLYSARTNLPSRLNGPECAECAGYLRPPRRLNNAW